MYSDDFINSDGFNKETYFKLIKDTWQSYPDISYSTVIKNINCSGNYATAEVTEKAVATSEEILSEDDIVTGELHSSADTIYYFKKSGSGWLISSEKILRETSSLTYGEARYTNIELSGPNQINAGEQYSALLTVDRPKNCVVVASLNQEKIVYPAQNAQDSFRKLSDDNTLERIFTSNKENVNEYVVASVALTRADASIYLSGLGFVMTRVNIIPENNSIKQEDENVESK